MSRKYRELLAPLLGLRYKRALGLSILCASSLSLHRYFWHFPLFFVWHRNDKQSASKSPPHDYSQEGFVIEQLRVSYHFENDGTGRRELYSRVKVRLDSLRPPAHTA
jgi:hypothetical protein